jgi:hypothetical protein
LEKLTNGIPLSIDRLELCSIPTLHSRPRTGSPTWSQWRERLPPETGFDPIADIGNVYVQFSPARMDCGNSQ